MSELKPVIFGWDLGDYAFARLANETTGVISLLYTEIMRGYIDNSSILEVRMVPKGTLGAEDTFISLLHEIAAEFPTERLLLMVNTDEGVQAVARHRDELESNWVLPYASIDAIETANSKERISQVFTQLGLATPSSVTVSLDEPESYGAALDRMTFPVVLKPGIRSDLNANIRLGLEKVVPVARWGDARQILRDWHEAGISTDIVIQELIPGDDTTQWMINGFADPDGNVTAIGTARVLLGMHQRNLVGNAGIAHVVENMELAVHAERVVNAIGLTGFFSFDVKIDPRTNIPYWLDLNPRIGRNHYYLTGGGINVYQALLDSLEPDSGNHEAQSQSGEAIYHVLPLTMLTKSYITDPDLRAHARSLVREGKVVSPMKNPADKHPKRTLFRLANAVNQTRQMKAVYPKSSESGF